MAGRSKIFARSFTSNVFHEPGDESRLKAVLGKARLFQLAFELMDVHVPQNFLGLN